MKIYKVIQTNSIEKIECDWCHQTIMNNPSLFAVNNFVFRWDLGKRDKSGSTHITRYEVDLCHQCRNRLFTKIKKLGITVNSDTFVKKPENHISMDDLNLQPPTDI